MRILYPNIILSVILVSCFCIDANAQARVTGHVFAEVVEMAEARAEAHHHISMQKDTLQTIVELGTFSFRGGSDYTGTVVVHSCSITGCQGSTVPFTAQPDNNTYQPVMNEQGNGVVNMTGAVDAAMYAMADKNYSGQYHVVFAYN